jgi:ABC-2 type transport system permease protein
MNLAIFLRIIKDKRTAFIAYTIGALLTIEMYVALFPAIQKQAVDLNKMLEAFPKGFMEAFGFNGTEALFSKVESYMSTEYFSFFWPIMVVTMVVAFANLMIVTEIERGTIEMSLAQPVSRLKLFFSRYLAGALYFVTFAIISIFAIIPIAKLNDVAFKLENYWTITGISILFGLSVFSIAAFFSSIFSEKGRATACSAALLILMYLMNIVGTLKDSLQNVQKFSIFYYFNPTEVFGNNHVVQNSIPVFVCVILAFTLAAAFWFNRRDIAV